MPRFIPLFLFISYQASTKRGVEIISKIRKTTTLIITSIINGLAASGNSF
jgi:hypothetical protein